MLRFSAIATLGLLATRGAGASVHRRWDSVAPLFDTDPGAPSECSLWWNTDDGLPCDAALTIAGATEADLTRLNPSVKSCRDWESSRSYCVGSPSAGPETDPEPEPVAVPSPTTRPSTPTTTPTRPSNGVQTPEPIQPGMVDNCSKFYLVKRGQDCNEVARQAGVSLDQLTGRNPSVGGSACSGLWADANVCVGVIGPTPTGPADGIETPRPAQPGMVDNCNRFHLVVDGDNCWSVATKYGLGESLLHLWNKDIGGTACKNMWTGYNICIGVSGGGGNGGGSPTVQHPANPTPQSIQDGMVGNCDRFHLVGPGDNCWNVARRYGVSEPQLQRWNAGIGGAACGGMWTGYHLCVGVSGGGSQTQPPQPPPASGTPQPVQDGMVRGCKRFHPVQGGQNCEGISRTYGIGVGDFVRWNPAAGSDCRGLWANTYACVGV